MDYDLNKIIEKASSVKLPGGVFGKTCTVLIVVSLAMFGIAWTARNVWISSAALIMIFILVFIMLWRLINFANKNPQAAILEGSEFLLHEHMQLAAKGIPHLPKIPTLYMEDKPIQIEPEQLQSLNTPDENAGEREVVNG